MEQPKCESVLTACHDALVSHSYKFVSVNKCHSDIKNVVNNKVFNNHILIIIQDFIIKKI